MPSAMLGLSHREDQNTPHSFPSQPATSLGIASISKTLKPPHREKEPHVLTMPSQPKDSDTSQIPSLCLLKDGPGTQAARVKGQVKGHRALEVTYRGK